MLESPPSRSRSARTNTPDSVKSWVSFGLFPILLRLFRTERMLQIKRVTVLKKSPPVDVSYAGIIRSRSPTSQEETPHVLREIQEIQNLLQLSIQRSETIFAAVTSSPAVQTNLLSQTSSLVAPSLSYTVPLHSHLTARNVLESRSFLATSLSGGAHIITPTPTPFSVPKTTYQVGIGHGKLISISIDDLRDTCDYNWTHLRPKLYIEALLNVWDDEHPLWMGISRLNVGGEPIAMKYWREMWRVTGKAFPKALLTSWHTRQVSIPDRRVLYFDSLHLALDGRTQKSPRHRWFSRSFHSTPRETGNHTLYYKQYQASSPYSKHWVKPESFLDNVLLPISAAIPSRFSSNIMGVVTQV